MGHRLSLLSRLTASAQRLDAVELQDDVVTRRCTPTSEVCRGTATQVVGRLREIVYTPSETVPTLVAELFDGSAAIDLVWLGRRRIPGVEPGRRLVARGRIGEHNGRHAIYNPYYELLPPIA
ncbi:OB-fold nucleic acid binding domain-containing protein [uncultured Jatrophihabitans sp.]|uniref:OB-fold nucleic acid binding domain-containing protein n=1 Tax=uncultured Jatrophihabitans sp. TaxID=1610747 RepID=UPI0035C9563C